MALAIDESRCVLCGLCISDCPAGAFSGEGEHMVGQSRVYDSVTLDNDRWDSPDLVLPAFADDNY